MLWLVPSKHGRSFHSGLFFEAVQARNSRTLTGKSVAFGLFGEAEVTALGAPNLNRSD